jgi:tRNA-dihydrouridine synthase
MDMKNIIDSFTVPGVIEMDTIKYIRFIYRGTTLSIDSSSKIELQLPECETIVIHVFTLSIEIREKLVNNIFITLKSFLPKKEEPIVMTDSIINSMNTNIVTLFSDTDFVNLLRIILNKPHLLNIASSYIQHGNVVEVKISDSHETTFTFMEQYNTIMDILKRLNVNIEGVEDEVKNLLCHFKGHINLTLRSLLVAVYDL